MKIFRANLVVVQYTIEMYGTNPVQGKHGQINLPIELGSTTLSYQKQNTKKMD